MCAAKTEAFEFLAIAWMISQSDYISPSTMYQNPKLEICFTKAIVFSAVENVCPLIVRQLCENFLTTCSATLVFTSIHMRWSGLE
jgi:hypothetical protein